MNRIQAVFALLAAILFWNAGFQMLGLQSQAGNTVAELFDHAMGWFSIGCGLLSVAYGVGALRGDAHTRQENA